MTKKSAKKLKLLKNNFMTQQTDFYKNKKVLVAGGAGFVGTNLIQKLVELGANVRAVDIKKEPQLKGGNFEYLVLDLQKKEDCKKAVDGTDYVFMLAANTAGAAVMEKTPLVHVTPNIIMNSLMLEASHEAGVKKFLFHSSNTVYPVMDTPAKESDMKFGDLFYKYYFVAWMKQFSEVLCEMYTKVKNPMQTIVVRPANIYGPFDHFEGENTHVIPALIKKIIEGQNPLQVWGDGNDVKDFIYIDDLVEGDLLAMEKMETFEPINIATGVQVTVKDVLKAVIENENFTEAEIVFDVSKPTMIPRRLIDASRARELLGFEAKTSLKDGLKKTVDWYKSIIKT